MMNINGTIKQKYYNKEVLEYYGFEEVEGYGFEYEQRFGDIAVIISTTTRMLRVERCGTTIMLVDCANLADLMINLAGDKILEESEV